MLIGIDHLVIAVADPDAAADELSETLGIPAGGGGRHDHLGTYNRLLWLGDTYLELIAVFDRTLAARSWVGAPTLRALEGGGGLATWAMATDSIDEDVARLRARGSDIGETMSGERLRPDGAVVRWRLAAAPRLGPDLPPFLIEHDTRAAEWTPAERATRANTPARVAILDLAMDAVQPTINAFLRTTGLRFRPSLVGGGSRDADIGRQLIRLRPRRPAVLPRHTVHVRSAGGTTAEVDRLGIRWRITADQPTPG